MTVDSVVNCLGILTDYSLVTVLEGFKPYYCFKHAPPFVYGLPSGEYIVIFPKTLNQLSRLHIS